MKDDEGRFYAPAFGHNSIPGWYVQEGYMMKVSEAATIELAGVSVLRDRPIALHEGWQLISYYPNFPVEATLALTNIVENLTICKDGYGNFYVPAWDYSNIGDMVVGQGYYLKMAAEDELVYTTVADGDERQVAQASPSPLSLSSPRTRGSIYDIPGNLPVHPVTGENMSLLVRMPPLNPPREPVGRETTVDVGVYAGGALVGSSVMLDGVCGIAVWGDDQTTEEIDGALDGQTLMLKLMTDAEMVNVGYQVLAGEMVYRKDALAVIELETSSIVPTEFAITSAYPNPFNSVTTISYSLPEQARVSLKLFDVSGREVETLVDRVQKAGNYSIPWNAIDFPSGVYFCRLNAKNEQRVIKLALVR